MSSDSSGSSITSLPAISDQNREYRLKNEGKTQSGRKVFSKNSKLHKIFGGKSGLLPVKIGERIISGVKDVNSFFAEEDFLNTENSTKKS